MQWEEASLNSSRAQSQPRSWRKSLLIDGTNQERLHLRCLAYHVGGILPYALCCKISRDTIPRWWRASEKHAYGAWEEAEPPLLRKRSDMRGVQLNMLRDTGFSGFGGRTPLCLPRGGRGHRHTPQQRLSTSALASGVDLSIRQLLG